MESNEVESVQVEQKKKDPKDLTQKIENVLAILGIVLCFIGAVVPRLSVKWSGDGAELEDIIMTYRERWFEDAAIGFVGVFFIVLGRLEKISWQVVVGLIILFSRIGSDMFFMHRLSRADHEVAENYFMYVLYIGVLLVIIAQIMRMCLNAPTVLCVMAAVLSVVGVLRVRQNVRGLITGLCLLGFSLLLMQLKKRSGPNGGKKETEEESEDEFYYL